MWKHTLTKVIEDVMLLLEWKNKYVSYTNIVII